MSEWESTANERESDEQGIAIIGMAGRFPGAATLDAFWRNLRDGVESIAFFTDEELAALGVDPRALSDPNFVKAGAVLEGVELFDAGFFGYSPREAELIDPQQRIFLECAWTALEHAGCDPRRYPGLIGVYAGMGMSTYLLFNLLSNTDILDEGDSPLVMLGNDKDFLSTRVSYNLNLKGPSIDVQTGCSTSLVAAHLACEHLLSYQCDMALAGGAAVTVPQRTGYYYQEGGIASPDGHCRAFDAQAQGSIFGSGVGVVVLKRLADALADGDTIYAVIKGSAINNDGALKVGFTAPSIEGQAEVIARAQAIAGVDPESITYVETHGTGTALGDPMEMTALTRVFRAGTDATGFCALGSVKTNIGHLDTAAGAAGLIKTVLALQHRQILPSLHFHTPNPQIDFANSPFYVNTALAEWLANGAPRRAGVSSFGFGGTNAHVILEEAPPAAESGPSRPWQLLLLSARSEAALEAATDQLVEHLRQRPEQPLADVAYTLQAGRAVFEHRRMLVCRDQADALQALEARDPRRIVTRVQRAAERPVVFMFAGMGDQYVNMAQELYQAEPIFRDHVDHCAALLEPELGLDLRDILYPDRASAGSGAAQALDLRAMLAAARGQTGETARKLNEPAFAQSAVFVVEYALARLLISWGVLPRALIGHSLGEYVAACLAGVFSLEDALLLVARRARMIQDLPGGAMLAVPLAEAEVQPLLGMQLCLSAVNGPAVCVVAGPPDAVAALEQQLSARGLACRRLLASHAMHSQMIEPIMQPFGDLVRSIDLAPPQIPYVSNLTGTWITDAEATDPAYWVRHLRETVRFADGLRALWDDPEQILLEIGPGQALSTLALEYAAGDGEERLVLQSVRPSYDRRLPDLAFLLSTLGRLWLAGAPIDWAGFYATERRQRVPLPTYPFERQRYWVEPRSPAERVTLRQDPLSKRDFADWFYVPSWKRTAPPEPISLSGLADDKRCWMVLMDEQGLGARLAKRLEQAGLSVISVTIGQRFGSIDDHSYVLDPQQRDNYETLFQELIAANTLPGVIVHLWNVTADGAAPAATETFEQAQARSFHSLLYLTQAIANQQIGDPVRIGVISNRMQEVSGDELLDPQKAMLIGPCRVIPKEYANISCQSIDIATYVPGTAYEQRLIDQLIAELTTTASESIIAYRGRYRWVQDFETVRLDGADAGAPRLREQGVYLITGGLGGIGLVLAEHLARTVQARLILVGRSAFPEECEWEEWLAAHDDQDSVSRKIRALQAITALGAAVLTVSADVCDQQQMQAVIALAQERFGAIHGMIHAAGIPGGGMAQLKTTEQIAQVLDPKVRGTLVLGALLQDVRPDFLMLCSSLTSILGEFGQVDYCAANAFLDAFAHYQRAIQGPFTIAINWDAWQEVGLAVNTAMAQDLKGWREETLKAGILSREGVEVFSRALRSALPQLVVSTRDLPTVIERTSAFEVASFLESLTESRPALARHPRPALQASYVPPENEVEQTVARVWQELLGIEQVGIHDNFFDLGGHSLLGLKIISRLRSELGVDIPVVSLFEGPTVSALAGLIARTQGDDPTYEESQRQGAARKRKIREKRQRKQYAAQESTNV